MPNYTEIRNLFETTSALFALENNAIPSVPVSDEDRELGFDAKNSLLSDMVKDYNHGRIVDFCKAFSATEFITSHMSVGVVVYRIDSTSFIRTKVQNLSLFDYFSCTLTDEVYRDFCADVKALKEKVFSRALNYCFADKQNSGCVSDVKKLLATFCASWGIDIGGKEISSWIARRLLQSVAVHKGNHVENVRAINDRTFVMLISIFIHCLINNVKPRFDADKEDAIAALITSITTIE